MARIHEVTRFGGRAQVLGRTCDFHFNVDRLEITGISYEDVHQILALIENHPGTKPEMERLLAVTAGRQPVQKPAEPAPRRNAVEVRVEGEVTPEAVQAAMPAPAAAAPSVNGAARAAVPTPDAEEEPAKPRRGRAAKPKAPEPNPDALDKILSRVGGPMNGAQAAPSVETTAPAPAETPAKPAPQKETKPAPEPEEDDEVVDDVDEDDDDDDDDDDLDDADDDDDDVDDEPAPPPARARVARPAPSEPKPEPKPAAAPAKQQEKLSAAEKRVEANEKAKGRSLVDDAEEEAAPRAAAPKAATNGTHKYLLDPKNLPKEVYEAKTMRALISYFVKNGVRTLEAIMAECERIREQSTMLKAVPDLRSRVEAALELLPPQPTA